MWVKDGQAPLWGGGFAEGATWANEQNAAELAALRAENAKLIEVSKIVSQDAKDFQRKYDAALQLAQEYKEQSDKQKTQIAELLKKYEK